MTIFVEMEISEVRACVFVCVCVFLHNLVFLILLCMSVRKALESLCNIVVYVQTLTLYKSLGSWCTFHVTLEQKDKGMNIQKSRII